MRLPALRLHEIAADLIQKEAGAWSAVPIRLSILEELDETL